MRLYDSRWGGFGTAPKFPTVPWLLFLLRYSERHGGDGRARVMVEETLRAMRLGGIFDQLGYGFHRYSTDAGWLVPHFEKMLYDQALLALAYTEAFRLWGETAFREHRGGDPRVRAARPEGAGRRVRRRGGRRQRGRGGAVLPLESSTR